MSKSEINLEEIVGITTLGSGAGDMSKAIYDPENINGDSFDMGNMVEDTDNKILNHLERVELDNLSGYLNGMSVERQELTIVVDGTSVYLDVQAIDGGNIEYWIDGVKYVLDCTTGGGVDGKARAELTQGTAITPRGNLVYVSYSEQLGKLVLNTTLVETPPNEDYAPVAIVTIQDYSNVSTSGALVLQRTTETIQHSGKGAISWEREKLRALGAQYWSGIDQSLNITTNAGSEDDIDFTVTGGSVFQLHRQQLGSVVISTDGITVANASGDGVLTNFQKLTNLNNIHEISDGVALSSGDCINVVIWGSVNYGGENKLFLNLPTGKYTNSTDAKNDIDNTAVTVISNQFKTTGFLIAKLVLRYTSSNNGTWENLLSESISTWHTATQTWATPNYPSNYPNSYDGYLATLTHSGAEAIRAVFEEFNTEANYDFIRLRNAAGTDIYSYHGNLGAFTSANISGDTIRVWFHSDGSVTRRGVRGIRYEYMTTASVGQSVIDLRGIPTGFNLGAGGGVSSTADMLTRVSVPSSASASGTLNQIAIDSDYFYVCISTDTLKRTALSTWV